MYIADLLLLLRYLNKMAHSICISFVERGHFYAGPLHNRIRVSLVNRYQRLKIGVKGYHSNIKVCVW